MCPLPWLTPYTPGGQPGEPSLLLKSLVSTGHINDCFPVGIEILQNEEVKRRRTLSPAHGTENSHCGLWSFVTLQQFLEVALPATAGNTYLALCLGPSGPRACALCWPAVLRDPAALLHPHVGTRNRPMPWTERPLLFTFFISVSLASHLEGDAS